MSDTWYREPLRLSPYEDGFGNLWTLAGECINPVHTCERPEPLDLFKAEIEAQLYMGFREQLEAEMAQVWCFR